MRVSAVLSIHNRSLLFSRAIPGYLWQGLPPDQWEIVLVDDCSTEDLSAVIQPYVGRMNLRHVRFDHKLHPLWKEKNPNWQPGQPEDWYHTPSLTTNVGCYLAQGDIIGLFHPEMLLAPDDFRRACEQLDQNPKQYLFGRTYLGTQQTNRWLDENNWQRAGWDQFLRDIGCTRLEQFQQNSLYWYTSFLPKAAVEAVGGVDFAYLHGVAAEDDDFRDRVGRAGYKPTYDAWLQGVHQDHSHETEAHRLRTTPRWRDALARNRKLYFQRRDNGSYPEPANQGMDWTAKECIVDVKEYVL